MLHRVRLELARCHDFPNGSTAHGYELTLPLAKDGTLDRELWQKHRKESAFRRFWGDDEALGQLTHRHAGWALLFHDGGDAEVIFQAEKHHFVAGDYVSIKERDGATRTFRVASVT